MNNETAALELIRRWLKEGATLKATDPEQPVLETVDGVFYGGMTITYPPVAQWEPEE
jgi:hypothetical protein